SAKGMTTRPPLNHNEFAEPTYCHRPESAYRGFSGGNAMGGDGGRGGGGGQSRAFGCEEVDKQRLEAVDARGSSHCVDERAAATWIYPSNCELRQYQYEIAEAALFANTLVCLPTGVGKTLIAAVVMANYYRWFPHGKIVFMAPTRPLVLQQIRACHNVVAIPQVGPFTAENIPLSPSASAYLTLVMRAHNAHDGADGAGAEGAALEGAKMAREQRAQHWRERRVFFVTGQVLLQDMVQWGEWWCSALNKAGVAFRVLALTATPGSQLPKVQEVVDKLAISLIEYRGDDDPQVAQYMHKRTEQVIKVRMHTTVAEVEKLFAVKQSEFISIHLSSAVAQPHISRSLPPPPFPFMQVRMHTAVAEVEKLLLAEQRRCLESLNRLGLVSSALVSSSKLRMLQEQREIASRPNQLKAFPSWPLTLPPSRPLPDGVLSPAAHDSGAAGDQPAAGGMGPVLETLMYLRSPLSPLPPCSSLPDGILPPAAHDPGAAGDELAAGGSSAGLWSSAHGGQGGSGGYTREAHAFPFPLLFPDDVLPPAAHDPGAVPLAAVVREENMHKALTIMRRTVGGDVGGKAGKGRHGNATSSASTSAARGGPSSAAAAAISPKLVELEKLLLLHFREAQQRGTGDTRAIIFSTFRDSVQEEDGEEGWDAEAEDLGEGIVHEEQERAEEEGDEGEEGAGEEEGDLEVRKRLMGQSQKQQQEVLDVSVSWSQLPPFTNLLILLLLSRFPSFFTSVSRFSLFSHQGFKAGTYNVLVSTTIGEEGLYTMCFSAVPSCIFCSSVTSLYQGFKAGTYNVLVSTTIGEEGLDISQLPHRLPKPAVAIVNIQPPAFSPPRSKRRRPSSSPASLDPSAKKARGKRASGVRAASEGSPIPVTQLLSAEADALSRYPSLLKLVQPAANWLGGGSGGGEEVRWKPSLTGFLSAQTQRMRTCQVAHSDRSERMLVGTLRILQGTGSDVGLGRDGGTGGDVVTERDVGMGIGAGTGGSGGTGMHVGNDTDSWKGVNLENSFHGRTESRLGGAPWWHTRGGLELKQQGSGRKAVVGARVGGGRGGERHTREHQGGEWEGSEQEKGHGEGCALDRAVESGGDGVVGGFCAVGRGSGHNDEVEGGEMEENGYVGLDEYEEPTIWRYVGGVEEGGEGLEPQDRAEQGDGRVGNVNCKSVWRENDAWMDAVVQKETCIGVDVGRGMESVRGVGVAGGGTAAESGPSGQKGMLAVGGAVGRAHGSGEKRRGDAGHEPNGEVQGPGSKSREAGVCAAEQNDTEAAGGRKPCEMVVMTQDGGEDAGNGAGRGGGDGDDGAGGRNDWDSQRESRVGPEPVSGGKGVTVTKGAEEETLNSPQQRSRTLKRLRRGRQAGSSSDGCMVFGGGSGGGSSEARGSGEAWGTERRGGGGRDSPGAKGGRLRDAVGTSNGSTYGGRGRRGRGKAMARRVLDFIDEEAEESDRDATQESQEDADVAWADDDMADFILPVDHFSPPPRRQKHRESRPTNHLQPADHLKPTAHPSSNRGTATPFGCHAPASGTIPASSTHPSSTSSPHSPSSFPHPSPSPPSPRRSLLPQFASSPLGLAARNANKMRFLPPRRDSVPPRVHAASARAHCLPPSARSAPPSAHSAPPSAHSAPPRWHQGDAREGTVSGSGLAEGRSGHGVQHSDPHARDCTERERACEYNEGERPCATIEDEHGCDNNAGDRSRDTNKREAGCDINEGERACGSEGEEDIFEGIDLDALEAEAWASKSRGGGGGSGSSVGGGRRDGRMSGGTAISSAAAGPSSQYSPATAATGAATRQAFPATPPHTAASVPTPASPTIPPQSALSAQPRATLPDASHNASHAFPGACHPTSPAITPRAVAASAAHAAQLKDGLAVAGTPVAHDKPVCEEQCVGGDEVFGDIDLDALEAEALQKSQHKKQRAVATFEARQSEVFGGIDLDALEAEALEQSQRKRWGAAPASEGTVKGRVVVVERGVGAGVEGSLSLSPQWCACVAVAAVSSAVHVEGRSRMAELTGRNDAETSGGSNGGEEGAINSQTCRIASGGDSRGAAEAVTRFAENSDAPGGSKGEDVAVTSSAPRGSGGEAEGGQWKEKALNLEKAVGMLQARVAELERALEKERTERAAERRGRIRAEQQLRTRLLAPAAAGPSSSTVRAHGALAAESPQEGDAHGDGPGDAHGDSNGVTDSDARDQSDGCDVAVTQHGRQSSQEQRGQENGQEHGQENGPEHGQERGSVGLSTYPMTPIGVIRSCFSTRNGTPRQPLLVPAARAYLELPRGGVAPAALQGLEGYSHCWLLYVFHANTDIQRLWSDPHHRKFRAKVRVPRLQGGKLGALATRTPHRPVPIGLSIAKVERVEGRRVLLSGADLVDGSPVLDIKPYLPYSDALPSATVPQWVEPSGEGDGMHMASVSFHPAVSTQLQHAWSSQSHRSLYSHPDDLQELCRQPCFAQSVSVSVSVRCCDQSKAMLSVSNAAAVAANTFSNGAARIAVSRRGLEPALTGRSTTKSASLTGKRGASPAVTVFCSANPHTGASTSAPSASAPSTSASAMTSDSGEAASFRQMSPEEHWWWGTPDYLMGNWHGQWRSWKPMQSTDEIRSMKSVRKLWATSPDLSSFAHMNDWYDHQGEVSKQPPRQGVQWDMSLAEHSLPDGFCHVANSNARRYVVSRQADAIWAPLEIADGEGGIKLPFLVEFFFSRTPTARLGSMVGFEQDGAFRTSVVVEESLDTNERRPSDWVWPTWGPGGVPSLLPDQLPPVPALDDKTMVALNTSAPSTSASSMASDGGEAAPFRQMSTEEHWWWGTPERLMTNWHGQWRCWKPLESTDAIRSFKSVRKFWATSPDRSSFAHMNDFYDEQGEVPKFRPPVGVQWDMSLTEHSLPDGFCHVAVGTARRHSVSREGDGIWGPLEVGDGAGGIKPFVEEFFFSHTPTSRFGCMIGYDPEGALRAYVAAEDSLDTNERRPSDWVWPTWGPGGVPSQLPDHLPSVPALDDKTMVGTRTILTRNLMVQERENVSWAEEWGPNSAAAAAAVAAAAATATAASAEKSAAADAAAAAAAAAAAGFVGRVPEGDEDRYAAFALPHGVVVCAPRSLQLVAGRPFVLSVSWVVGEGEVKRITASWGSTGSFEKVEGEWYKRQA
ncbi:unnamed protein product, partial [Closterium sp. Yama58-4]